MEIHRSLNGLRIYQHTIFESVLTITLFVISEYIAPAALCYTDRKIVQRGSSYFGDAARPCLVQYTRVLGAILDIQFMMRISILVADAPCLTSDDVRQGLSLSHAPVRTPKVWLAGWPGSGKVKGLEGVRGVKKIGYGGDG
jgi:hypothetical protein